MLAALDEMGCAQVDVIDRSRLRLVVDQAPTDLPLIMRHLDEAGIGVKESSEVPVDWDEAFIALVGPRERE